MTVQVLVSNLMMLNDQARFESAIAAKGWVPVFADVDQFLSEDQCLRYAGQCDAWLAGDDRITRNVLAAFLPRLKGIAKWGTGLDSIDLVAARELSIPVLNTPAAFSEAVAEVAVGYMLMLTRHLLEVDQAVRRGGWPKPRGLGLYGRACGIIGFGAIGQGIARRIKGCGMSIMAYDPPLQAKGGVIDGPLADTVFVDLDRLITESDVVCVACNLTVENRHIIGEKQLKAMKREAILVNVGRGPLVDEVALAAALASGGIAGAGLDVFEVEPLPGDSPLRAFPNVVLGSHNANNLNSAVEYVHANTMSNLAKIWESKLPATKVLIVSEHLSRGYSGGRYYAWMMAEALAATGVAVTVWTNVRPFLMRDFVDFPAHERIVLHVDPHFRHGPTARFDAIFLVPTLRLDWSVYAAAVSTAVRQRAPLVFLDYEAPSWYNAENARKRSWLRVLPWKLSARYAEVILSFTALGSQKAREYYRPVGGATAFRHCYCPINSFAADQAPSEPQNQIICITRLDRATPHKGATDLMSLMCDELRGFRIVVIGSIPDDVKRELEDRAASHGMTFVSKSGLTDLEKFREIKSSRLMVFLSHFEGFGYPPVEALYCGVPCVARSLPVLREVNGDYLHYLPEGTSVATFVARVLAETNGELPPEAGDHATRVAKFESYVERMRALLSDLRSTRKPAGGRAGASVFAGIARLTGLLYRVASIAR